MKKIIYTFLSLSIFIGCYAQEMDKFKVDISTTNNIAQEKYWKEKIADLYEAGISKNKDSMHISAESKRVMQDPGYKSIIFPKAYTWTKTTELLNNLEFKKGFWYLIKIYSQDTASRRLVIQTLLPFDKTFKMDMVLISTFYTYAMLDPEVGSIKNNKLQIDHPDKLEKEFNEVKELISFINFNRKPTTVSKKMDQ